MNQNDCSGKTLNPWPVLLDHHTFTNTEDKFMDKFYLYIGDKSLLSDPELWDLSQIE